MVNPPRRVPTYQKRSPLEQEIYDSIKLPIEPMAYWKTFCIVTLIFGLLVSVPLLILNNEDVSVQMQKDLSTLTIFIFLLYFTMAVVTFVVHHNNKEDYKLSRQNPSLYIETRFRMEMAKYKGRLTNSDNGVGYAKIKSNSKKRKNTIILTLSLILIVAVIFGGLYIDERNKIQLCCEHIDSILDYIEQQQESRADLMIVRNQKQRDELMLIIKSCDTLIKFERISLLKLLDGMSDWGKEKVKDYLVLKSAYELFGMS